ncbi:MAG: hypothetical protein IJ125_03975 [Atopobiaceae bacterium]|nr:hypothetical protein [Atopobiaceae bacterium]
MQFWKGHLRTQGGSAQSLALNSLTTPRVAASVRPNVIMPSDSVSSPVITPQTDTAVQASEAASQKHSSLELLKKLPSPADEPETKAGTTNFMRVRSETIASRLANIEHCIYPVRRDPEKALGADMWESALAALDEQLSRYPVAPSAEEMVAGTPGSLEDPDGFEQVTAVLSRRIKRIKVTTQVQH